MPLTFDQRHTLTTQIDYGFEGGSRYNGPTIKRKLKNTQTDSKNEEAETKYINLLENFSISTILRAGSGTPFTKQVDPTPEAMFGVAKRSNLDGSINGSYSPFTFKIDVQVNKAFPLKVAESRLDNQQCPAQANHGSDESPGRHPFFQEYRREQDDDDGVKED